MSVHSCPSHPCPICNPQTRIGLTINDYRSTEMVELLGSPGIPRDLPMPPYRFQNPPLGSGALACRPTVSKMEMVDSPATPPSPRSPEILAEIERLKGEAR